MTKQTPRQRKALRSAAAKKGWETRRVRAHLASGTITADDIAWAEREARAMGLILPPEPPSPFILWLRRLWSKLIGR